MPVLDRYIHEINRAAVTVFDLDRDNPRELRELLRLANNAGSKFSLAVAAPSREGELLWYGGPVRSGYRDTEDLLDAINGLLEQSTDDHGSLWQGSAEGYNYDGIGVSIQAW